MNVYWTRNGKDTKTHIEGAGMTLCGVEIPYYDGVDRAIFNEPTCKRCIKTEKRNYFEKWGEELIR